MSIVSFVYPGINPALLWCMDLGNVLLDWFANTWLRIFTSVFIRNIGLGFPFFVAYLTGSGICFFFVVVLTWNIFGSFPFSSFFLMGGGVV